MFYSHNNSWQWLKEEEIENINDFKDAKYIKNHKNVSLFVLTLTKSKKEYDNKKFYFVLRSAMVIGDNFYGSGKDFVDERIFPDKYLPIEIVFGDKKC